MSKYFSFRNRGYALVGVICAAAVGLMGYAFYREPVQTQPESDVPVLADSPTSISHQNQPVQPTGDAAPSVPEKATKPTAGKLTVCMPVDGQIISGYAVEVLAYNQTTRDWRTHNGIDIAAEAGTNVSAAAAGEVYTVYEDEQMGMTVVIRHEGGYTTKYASLASDVLVSPGDQVVMGQAIGCVGSTALMESALGDHVHFSVTRDGEDYDPEAFLAG